MTSTDKAREIATALITKWMRYLPNDEVPARENKQRLIEMVAAALNPPPGCVRDEQGVDRKVLGTLPVTADGCVVGHRGEIYCLGTNREVPFIGLFQSSMTECDDFSAEPFNGTNWFGTTEAAAAAQSAKGGK